ncbi:MAG: NADPH-dependent F420 reductase [Methanomicrobiales archaeon]|nr:NADPH-dependent F420 reductase [Methanomicrobiales archaeon]MDI6877220.1 NADPH-dependent F420 reductase [Methanomicrobiales archaeon]
MRLAIIGKGNVGTALGRGLSRAGHDIRFGHRDPREPVREAAEWGEAIILAVPFSAVNDVVRAVGPAADGKPLIDVTNALDENMELAIGFTTSAAEELQKRLPGARVIKAFNTVFAQNQSSGRLGGEQLTAFIAGDDAEAKRTAVQLARDIGFDPVDVGPLKSARYLEPMAIMLIGLGYGLNMGTGIGYRLVRS